MNIQTLSQRRARSGTFVFTGLAAAGLLAAGCGSSSTSSSPSSAGSTAAATPAASTPASGGYGSGGASSTPATPPAASGPAQIAAKHSAKLGTILSSGAKGLSVYLLTADHGTTSSCTGQCAQIWPPVLTGGAPTVDAGAQSSLVGTTHRPDGTTQVTYHGHPLYYFAKDGDSGDAYGQGIKSFGGEWYVLSPAGTKVDQS